MFSLISKLNNKAVACSRLPIRNIALSNVRWSSQDNKEQQKSQDKQDTSQKVVEPEETQKKGKISRVNHPTFDGGPFSWRSILIGGSIFGIVTSFVLHIKKEKQEKIALERSRSYGKPAIGGEFELVDTTGKLRSTKEFFGKWVIVYFGFTHCPDVCPEELEKIAEVVDRMEKNYKQEIIPLFISVDPERDTPELVGKYLEEFSKKFIGLTGTKEQVEKATRTYRVYYSVGPKDKDNDYIVDHTIISYLVDPKGELADYFGQTKTVDEMEATIALKIMQEKYKN